MKIKCAICGRIYKSKIPRGGDGTEMCPRKHYRNIGLNRNERILDNTICSGSFHSGELIEEEQ